MDFGESEGSGETWESGKSEGEYGRRFKFEMV